MTSLDEAKIRARYEAAGQGHVFRYFEELSSNEKDVLLQQLHDIQVEKLASLLEAARTDSLSNDHTQTITPFSKHVGRTTDPNVVQSAYSRGIEALSQGQVAALVLAGGQGTRLGFDGPKGCYDIGLPSGKTLFQLLSERLCKLKCLTSDASIPFYIMTSPINHQETVDYFQQHEYFGLSKDDVLFFQQGMLPCLTEDDGKIIMETPSTVAMAPDGNGGIYPSLQQSGMMDDMIQRGIHYLHVFSIDNALTKIADPTFVGYCIQQNADCGNKVVWKVGPHEKVGVIAEKDGTPCVVEYSEISTEMAERVDDQGRLVFGAGNICNHFYTIDFLRDKVMPNLGTLYHIARKKIPYWDESTRQTVTPETNNGIKLESFIFDIFPFAERMAILDTERDEEFSPVKNAPGSDTDSPDTARQHLSQQAQKWVIAAGGTLTGNRDSGICEISPLTSYGGEGLDELVKGKTIECPFNL
ncbi:UDP-N-acetylglucosamine pyrophosphorylase [Nitzschia inconspicua]|uniref:UDP-N-acetylglucosamine diphosphorylase n=1 Tax=Nitzschia inconspicua TaxID=303405 RepID=A0A9K3L4K3_9STRA|nr:UDP-N-acetylglucosamine pyrophosphorylase [Nitzschia inconspicua]